MIGSVPGIPRKRVGHWLEKPVVPITLGPAARAALNSLNIKLSNEHAFSIGPGTAAMLRGKGVGILAGRYILVSKEELDRMNRLKARRAGPR